MVVDGVPEEARELRGDALANLIISMHGYSIPDARTSMAPPWWGRPVRQSGRMAAYEPMAVHLETGRLRLRPWEEGDAERLRELFGERGAGVPTVEEARRDIGVLLGKAADSGVALLPVVRRAEGDFIGYCGLTVGRATAEEPEIAYELLRRAHGFGYATEAARAVVEAAAATGRKRLWSTVRTWNAASFRVLDKLGFERDRVTKDARGELVWLSRSLVG
jgi:RimJ/RimL family protein N-acetyltransferase